MRVNKQKINYLKEFISNNENLIRQGNYTQIYDELINLDDELPHNYQIMQLFTQTMLKIGENPFKGLSIIPAYSANAINIERIDIPDSIVIIEEGAFADCEQLKEIKFSKRLIKIEINAFKYCPKLEKIELPDSIDEIEYAAFAHCYNLQSVTLGKNLLTLGPNVFDTCNKLKNIFYNNTFENWGYIAGHINIGTTLPEGCILHCTDGDYIFDKVLTNWINLNTEI